MNAEGILHEAIRTVSNSSKNIMCWENSTLANIVPGLEKESVESMGKNTQVLREKNSATTRK